MLIRKFDEDTDTGSLRGCLIELQEFERSVDSRMPAGEEIADAYMSDMFLQCAMSKGTIFVAEADGRVIGFVTLLSHCSSGELDDGDVEFALVSDIVVREEFRGLGAGRQLLEIAEKQAREDGAQWLRVSVLARNQLARNLYEGLGFAELYIDFEKTLTE
jgi:ribosomal protein S18 acetylase RimI-like enzyme